MHIIEGRKKGATTALLLEALHNEGVYVTANSQQKRFAVDVLDEMIEKKMITEQEKEYLKRNIFWIRELRGGSFRKQKMYIDSGLKMLEEFIAHEAGRLPEIIALGNNPEQSADPEQLIKTNSSFTIPELKDSGNVRLRVRQVEDGVISIDFIHEETGKAFGVYINNMDETGTNESTYSIPIEILVRHLKISAEG